jgi:hypothetical protein
VPAIERQSVLRRSNFGLDAEVASHLRDPVALVFVLGPSVVPIAFWLTVIIFLTRCECGSSNVARNLTEASTSFRLTRRLRRPPKNQTLQRTGAAGKLLVVREVPGRRPGR